MRKRLKHISKRKKITSCHAICKTNKNIFNVVYIHALYMHVCMHTYVHIIHVLVENIITCGSYYGHKMIILYLVSHDKDMGDEAS